MKYNILRENDIRGLYPDEINEEAVSIIASSFAVYIKENNENVCLLGHDNRLSSEKLYESVSKTLLSSGINVIKLGLVTTPMFNYATIIQDIPYGIMVTASHNPASDNGLKIFGKDHLHLPSDELENLYSYIKDEKKTSGSGKEEKLDIKTEYINMLVNKFGVINKKIVVDPGNGTSAIIIKDIFSKIFLNVSYINSNSDGSFPIHNPDPNVEDNLKILKDQVKLRKADLGIAIDGDADRVGIVDENGDVIPTDYLIAIFAKDIININKDIILDVKCSSGVYNEIIKMGGNPIMVKNGSAYIEKVCRDKNILLGGEYSGHIFFRDDFYGFDDGIYAALRMAQKIDIENINASYLTSNMEKLLSTEEIRIKVDDNIKEEVVLMVQNYVKSKGYDCSFIDGVRVNYPDGFALIRKSNTGPYLTIRFEAADEETLKNRQNEFMDLINKFI